MRRPAGRPAGAGDACQLVLTNAWPAKAALVILGHSATFSARSRSSRRSWHSHWALLDTKLSSNQIHNSLSGDFPNVQPSADCSFALIESHDRGSCIVSSQAKNVVSALFLDSVEEFCMGAFLNLERISNRRDSACLPACQPASQPVSEPSLWSTEQRSGQPDRRHRRRIWCSVFCRCRKFGCGLRGAVEGFALGGVGSLSADCLRKPPRRFLVRVPTSLACPPPPGW